MTPLRARVGRRGARGDPSLGLVHPARGGVRCPSVPSPAGPVGAGPLAGRVRAGRVELEFRHEKLTSEESVPSLFGVLNC